MTPDSAVPVDSVLLIDGDNDPHMPPGYELSARALVRVFLRRGADIPKALARKLSGVPNCTSVPAPRTTGNAADFVMALHAGVLHATIPMNIPFLIVTNDKGLAVIVEEFQRVGRQAALWTSHEAAEDAPAPASRRGAARRGRRGRGKAAAKAAEPPAEKAPEAAPAAPADDAVNGQAAADYARRLMQAKDPPSRLKSLLRDIQNRAKPKGCDPKAVVDLLVGAGVVSVDGQGRVTRGPAPV